MRKRISSFLAILLVLSVFAGCNNNSGTPTSMPTPTENAGGEKSNLPLSDTPTSFSYWCGTMNLRPTSGLQTWADSDVFKELEKRTNVSVDFIHPTGSSIAELFSLLLAAGDYPDVMAGTSVGPWPGGYDRYIADGTIIDLRNLYAEFAPNITATINLDPDLLRNCITDSQYMPVVPVVQYQSVIGPTGGLGFRGDWLDEQGIDPGSIVTYDDLRVVLRQLKDAYNLQYPYLYNFRFQPLMELHLYGFNSGSKFIFDDDRNVLYAPMLEDYRNYLITYHSMMQEGLIDPNLAEYTTVYDFTPYWLREEVAFGFMMAFWSGDHMYQQGLTDDANFYLVGIDEPKFNPDIPLHTGDTTAYNFQYSFRTGVSFSTQCRDPELVMKWFDYCFTDEGKLLTNYGIEGIHFNYVDGVPTWSDLIIKNPDGLSLEDTQQRYLWHFPMFCDFDKELLTYSDPRQLQNITKWQSSTDRKWCLPTNYTMTADESSEYSTLFGDIQTFVNEQTMNFLVGNIDPNDDTAWNNYVQQIESMSIARVNALIQAACDRYYSR
ncbi:MAG: hypothetical protein LBL09_01140 [Oscillospiraceae bacterium]|jgi:putative aldouronate transport system substrate-binding protein|nr:hypothetical protein [Oscillospiraceae bacterium]